MCPIGQPMISLKGMSEHLQVAFPLRFEIGYLRNTE
jgi:hypothetical protein